MSYSGEPYVGSYFRGQGLNPYNPIRADSTVSELSSLSGYGCYALCAPVLSNTQNDGQGLGYTSVKGRLTLTSGLNIISGGQNTFYGWLVQASDGVNYETTLSGGLNSVLAPLARPADFAWPIEIQASGGPAIVKDVYAANGAPVCATMKLLVWNLACSGIASGPINSINLYYSIP